MSLLGAMFGKSARWNRVKELTEINKKVHSVLRNNNDNDLINGRPIS